jgi:hypothetical protein
MPKSALGRTISDLREIRTGPLVDVFEYFQTVEEAEAWLLSVN